MKKIFSFFLVLCVALCSFAIGVSAEETVTESKKPRIRVGYPIQERLTDIDGNGKYTGYSYEYLQKIAQLAGYEYEYITPEGNLNTQLQILLDMLEKGEIDVLSCMNKNEETEKRFKLTENSYGRVYSTLSVLEANMKYNQENFINEAKKGINIGVRSTATNRIEELKHFCTSNDVAMTMFQYDSEQAILDALKSGEIDAMLGIDLAISKGTKNVANFGGQQYYFAVTKGNDELAANLDEAILNQEKTDPSFRNRIYERYFNNNKGFFVLTEEEKKYVESSPAIRVLVASESAPFQYVSSENFRGISISLLENISKKTGLRFEYIANNKGMSLADNISSSSIDLLVGSQHSYAFADENKLILTQPYTTTETTVFYKENFDINVRESKILAVPRGDTIVKGLESPNVKYYDSLEDCIVAVHKGEADYGYGNSYSVGYYLSRGAASNISTEPFSGNPKYFGFALTSSTDKTLLTILNRAIGSIDENQIFNYLLQEIDVTGRVTVFLDYINMNPLISWVSVSIIATIVILAAIYIIKNREKAKSLKFQNDAKSQFLSNMSHEIRTPLNAIIGLNDMQSQNLESGNIEEAKDSVEKIHSSATHLLMIINDVLDMSKINEGKMTISPKVFNLYNMLNDIKNIYKINAQQNNVNLITEFDESVLVGVVGDELRLKQVLINLLSNAIKYNKPDGDVFFIVKKVFESETDVKIKFAVRDTGYGIKEDNLKRIFSAFEREDRIQDSEGAGLGLAISNSIVNLMGGKLNVETYLDKGSIFSFSLSFNKSNDFKDNLLEDENPYREVSLAGLSILVAEDNDINIMVIRKLLQSKGANVEVAKNGEVAKGMFEESAPGTYDIILMDIRMPIMDGLAAAKEIRALDRRDSKKIPIVALSANAFVEDIQKSLDAGMNAHLAKPIEPKMLYSTLIEILEESKKENPEESFQN